AWHGRCCRRHRQSDRYCGCAPRQTPKTHRDHAGSNRFARRPALASDNCARHASSPLPANRPAPYPRPAFRVRWCFAPAQTAFQGNSLTTSFASALTAARDSAASQHCPQGALDVVATPIGNLADISLRSLHVLQMVDCIACEDTRHTQGMLRSYGLERPGSQLLAVHQHNEAEAALQVIERLQTGQRIAYVSDAGTPGVSDPGARLCAALQAVGLRSIPLPGASSVTSAISVAGAITPAQGESGFLFAGFLPTKNAERLSAVQKLAEQPRCTVLLEA